MNKDIRNLIILFLFTASVIVFGYFSKIVFIPLTGNAHMMMWLVLAWVVLRLFAIKNKDSSLKDWNLFFLFLSLFMFLAEKERVLIYLDDPPFLLLVILGFLSFEIFSIFCLSALAAGLSDS